VTMFDDDPPPPRSVVWATPSPIVRRIADDDLPNMPGPGPPMTIDFDRGKPQHHWPYWREPWLRGYQAFVDEGLQLAISGSGDIGSTTFVLSLEPGTKVIYSWSTSIITMYSGTEQRISPFAQPKRRFEGTAFLLDGSSRDIRGTLMRTAAAGSTFMLALPFEEIVITADSPGLVIAVQVSVDTDWDIPGQRCIVLAPDGTSVGVVIQGSTSTTITVARVDANGNVIASTLGTAGRAGGRLMPIIPVLLDPQQGFTRYPVSVDLWSIRARAAGFGYAGSDAMGVGGLMTTFTDGPNVPFASLTDEDLLIWDRINATEDTTSEALDGGNEVVDLGALPFNIGARDTPDWARSVRYRSSSVADWAWFKAFIRHLRGRQGVFALSTNTPDLVFITTVSGGIKVQSSSVAGAGDYVSWFASGAHRRLAITASGQVGYFEVLGVTDNLDGTLTIALDVSVSGTVTKVSFLEQVRFERDDIEVMWDGGTFEINEPVSVCQDALDVPSRFIFDRIVTQNFAYSGIPPDTPPTTQPFSIPAGGHTYLFNFTSDRTLGFGGVLVGAGTVEAEDGMVLCIANNNTAAFAASCNHEDTGITPALRRFHNAGLISQGGAGKSLWYRYNAAVQRWIQIL